MSSRSDSKHRALLYLKVKIVPVSILCWNEFLFFSLANLLSSVDSCILKFSSAPQGNALCIAMAWWIIYACVKTGMGKHGTNLGFISVAHWWVNKFGCCDFSMEFWDSHGGKAYIKTYNVLWYRMPLSGLYAWKGSSRCGVASLQHCQWIFFPFFFFVLPFVCNLGSSVFRVILNFYPHCWQHAQDSLSWSRSLLRRLFLRWELFLRRVFCPQSYGRSSYSDVLHLLWPALCFSQAPDGGKGRPGTAISWINSSRLTLTPCVSVRMSQTD